MIHDKYLKNFGISSNWLMKIFPFYIIISDKSKILDKGPGFNWLDMDIKTDDYLADKFVPFYFFKKLTYESIQNDTDEEVVFKDPQNLLTLKGKAYFYPDLNSMLLLTSIAIHDTNIASKINSQDLEPYDQTLDMIFLKAMQVGESKKSLNLIRKLEQIAKDLAEENKKISSGRVFLNGEKIKEIRLSKLMTLDCFVNESLNHKCYISKSTIKRAESGVKVYFRTALDISNVLDVDVHEIIKY